ncbi:MAG: tRNA-(ms[2]io[6]A)-hydroxylase [Myxococcota bacterium]
MTVETDPTWVKTATSAVDDVLLDHAHCEKKAAASAMALVSAYPDHAELVSAMVKLAQEELRHFRQVHERILARGRVLGPDHGDPYVKELLKLIRTGFAQRRTDRLLVSSLIEARSCERLALLGEHLDDEALADFYRGLARSEAGHYRLFVRLAKLYDRPDSVDARLAELAEAEGQIVSRMPIEARVH